MTEQMAIRELEDYIELPFGISISNETCKIAIQALEEIQQYRAIGTVEELNKYLMAKTKLEELSGHTVDVTKLIHHFCETIFEGEKHEGFCILTNEDAKEWEQLKALGSIAELQALKEKNTPYKPKEYEDKYYACKCGNILLHKWRKYPTELMPKSEGLPYCMACGQHLDWE